MLLADAVEVHNLVIEVVQYFHLGRLLMKEHLCTARERFDVCLVLREDGDDLIRKCALAADVAERAVHEVWRDVVV